MSAPHRKSLHPYATDTDAIPEATWKEFPREKPQIQHCGVVVLDPTCRLAIDGAGDLNANRFVPANSAYQSGALARR